MKSRRARRLEWPGKTAKGVIFRLHHGDSRARTPVKRGRKKRKGTREREREKTVAKKVKGEKEKRGRNEREKEKEGEFAINVKRFIDTSRLTPSLLSPSFSLSLKLSFSPGCTDIPQTVGTLQLEVFKKGHVTSTPFRSNFPFDRVFRLM